MFFTLLAVICSIFIDKVSGFYCRFHGDCIKITEKEAKYIKYYFCKVCRTKNPLLKIKYRKNKKKDKEEALASEKKKEKFKKLKKKRSGMHRFASIVSSLGLDKLFI